MPAFFAIRQEQFLVIDDAAWRRTEAYVRDALTRRAAREADLARALGERDLAELARAATKEARAGGFTERDDVVTLARDMAIHGDALPLHLLETRTSPPQQTMATMRTLASKRA